MIRPANETRYLVAFSHVPGIGPARLASLRERFGSATAAWRASPAELSAVLDARVLACLEATRANLDIDGAMQRLAALGATVVSVDDRGYPERLRQLAQPPFVLYARGDMALLSQPCVAVVGARRATPYGLMATQRLAGDLAAAGVTIVSGLAAGIDAEAHRAALAANGATAAVLGCGLDVCYPASNRGLQRSIASRGLLVTEFPPGTPPTAGNFPARNRIISGLSQAVLVVEAGNRSGAMITARYAAEHGRDVFAVPGSIFSPASQGAHELLASGAGVARSADDILAALGLPPPRRALEPATKASGAAATVLAALGPEPMHIDDLGRQTGLSSAEVAQALSSLELQGVVRHVGGMRWVVAK